MADIALTLLEKIAGYLVAPVGRHLSYVFYLNPNVEALKDEADKLDAIKVGIQRRVDVAANNIEDIDPIVERWFNDVCKVGDEAKKIIQEKAEFPKGCFNNWCLSLKSRHSLSRSAKKKTLIIVELQNQGNKFDKVSCPAPPKPLIVDSSSSITLDSRKSMLNNIIKVLKSEEVRMVGICGMGGVGKTTMMEKVLKKATEDNLFDEYARSDVSQKLEFRKIQSDIAETLGLKLVEHSKEVRAGKVHHRLLRKKVLIILDDVWEEFDLKSLGIDLEGDHKRCKILYTSRIQGLWMDLESRICEFPLDVLPYGEAWNLFKEKVGSFLTRKPELVPTAKDILRECGGLPLSIVTLASSLRGKSKHTWDDTLSKLRAAQGFQGKVNESLKRSYDHLDDDAKPLFLLSSLFKEDSKIYVEGLVDIAVGLRLFNTISRVEEIRVRVFALLEHLHACYLVSNLEHSYEGKKYIKVHDVVRDVAKSIASMEKGALVFEHGDELKRSLEQEKFEHAQWISIITKERMELPTKLRCPKLELLLIFSDYSIKNLESFLVEGVEKLQVVNIRTYSLNSSFQYPKSLRTLCLQEFEVGGVTLIGNLLSLEILRIIHGSIRSLPKEIGKLTNLMVLDISDSLIFGISPGVLSSLINLEELYLHCDGLSSKWRANGHASLMELEALSKLHTLHILISDPRALPTTPILDNLKKYSIFIGYNIQRSRDYDVFCNKLLAISLKSKLPLGREFDFLLYNSEWIQLKGPFMEDKVLNFLREGSQTIVKYFQIENMNFADCIMASSLLCTLEILKISYIFSLRKLSCSLHAATGFGMLKKLNIENCDAMKNIFQVSSFNEVSEEVQISSPVISGYDAAGEVNATRSKLHFTKLENLKIEFMREVRRFCIGTNEIHFPQLRTLYLGYLPTVENLITGSSSEYSSDPEGSSIISFFPHKVSFPSLMYMTLRHMTNMKEIWGEQLPDGSFCNLIELYLEDCDSIEYVFHHSTTKYLVHLSHLEITCCKSLKEVVLAAKSKEKDGQAKQCTSSNCFLPGLKMISLRVLPELERFCDIVDDLELPELEKFVIIACPKFKTFAPGLVHTPNLIELSTKHKQVWRENLNSTIEDLYEKKQRKKMKKKGQKDDHVKDERR